MLAESYTELLTDWNHWAFELTLMFLFDIVIGLFAFPLFKRWLAAHDRKHHHKECNVE